MPALFLLFLFTFICHAKTDTFIQGNKGNLFFVEQFDKTVDDNVIAAFFYDKKGSKYFVDYLPYLSSKGTIKEGFYLDTETLRERYFVIQQYQIDSDTGMNWFEYFSVIVFSYSNGKLIKDEKLTSYFGSGGNIIKPNKINGIPYLFPYSEKEKIIQTVTKNEFRKWISGQDIKLKLKGKSFFFPEPLPINKSKYYLIKGDEVLRGKHASGWDYVIYKSKKGRVHVGWMPCSSTGTC